MGAIGRPSGATAASMPDEPVTKQGPLFGWHQLHQVLLDFDLGGHRPPKHLSIPGRESSEYTRFDTVSFEIAPPHYNFDCATVWNCHYSFE